MGYKTEGVRQHKMNVSWHNVNALQLLGELPSSENAEERPVGHAIRWGQQHFGQLVRLIA